MHSFLTTNLFFKSSVCKLIYLIFLSLGLSNLSLADTNNSTILHLGDDTLSDISVSRLIQIYVDPTNLLNRDEVAQLDSNEFSYNDSGVIKLSPNKTYWLKMIIKQDPANISQQEWLLDILSSSPNLDQQIQVYKVSEKNSYQISHSNNQEIAILERRRSQSSKFLFNLFQEESTALLIKVQPTEPIVLSASLWDPHGIARNNHLTTYFIGIFYGILLLIFLYNLLLNITVGDVTHTFYLFYLASIAVFIMAISGLNNTHFWNFLPNFSVKAVISSGSVAMLWGSLFWVTLLETRRYSPILTKILLACAPVSLLLALSPIFFKSSLILPYFIIISISILSLTLFTIVKNWQQNKNHPARLYLLAILCIPIGIFVYILHSSGYSPFPVLGYCSLHLAFAAHCFLVLLGLTTRTSNDNKMKYIELGKQHQTIVSSRRSEDEILSRALHDSLTGLPNRLALQKRIPEIIREAEIYQQSVAIVLINLSHFHEINNTLGHQNGDELLKIVTSRLGDVANNLENSTIIDTDANKQSVASIEGVTYGMVLLVDTQKQVEFAAKRVLTSMRKHFDFRDMSIDIGARLGVSLFPEHGNDLNTLIRRALVAMENSDKNSTYLTMYSPEIDPYSPRRLALMGELSQAIDQDDLLLYFQPQVDIDKNTVIGVEALARWKHPEHGFIPPDEFIPLAEKTGLTRKLTRWVIDKALEECASLMKQGMQLSVSVNLSAQNLQETNFVTRVKSLLAKHKVPPSSLILELTETAMMLDPAHAKSILTKLSKYGIRISIDDFGTGYSSLSYIKQLPIHEVKIDRTFILDMVTDKNDSVIVDTTLHMSHHLGLKVVAEGVETLEIMNILRNLGCDIAQGYYLTRPLSIDDLFAWLRSCTYNIDNINTQEVLNDLIPEPFLGIEKIT